jgi:signal transduction histidine kinase
LRFFLLAVLLPAVSAAQTVDLTTARAVENAAATRPQEVDFSGAEVIALPDNWRRTRRDEAAVVWYSVPLDAALKAQADRGGLALVVPRVAEDAAVWLNGERLEVGSGLGATRNRTLWLDLPRTLQRSGGNALEIRVAGYPGVRNGLSAMRLGAPGELRFAYEAKRFLQTSLPFFVVFLVALSLFAVIPLWLKTRRRAHLLYMALCVLWLPRTAVIVSPAGALPDNNAMWVAVILSSLGATALIAVLGVEYLERAGRSWQRLRRAIVACAALCGFGTLAWAFAAPLTPAAFSVLHWPLIAMLMAITAGHLRGALVSPRPASVFTAAALAVWALCVIHDFAQVHDLTDFDSFFWSPSAIFLVFLALIWRTVEGLALQRGRADEEVRHAVTRERQTVIAEERTRLLHDLHDGMGGQLITALRMARREEVPREQVARVIEDSLDDMRLIIDSLDLEERDLLPLLANLRYRLEPRLNAIGLELRWEVETLPELDYLTPETGLAIVRIVQEAVNNAVRHAGAKAITVRARPTGGAAGAAVELCVADDGAGFDPARPGSPGAGRGLNAMRLRAGRLGGELAVQSDTKGTRPGTRVLLTLPLRRG